jgi:putative phosphoribosyl transferase
MTQATVQIERSVEIRAGGVVLEGDLTVPPNASGIVVFAHATGSSRFSPLNRKVAATLSESGLATLLTDLLTEDEEAIDARTGQLRFNVGLLARRVIATIDWVVSDAEIGPLPLGMFGVSTGAAAALIAAAVRPERIQAVASRGGRPDLAGDALHHVRAPTLLIVGGADRGVLHLNEQALAALAGRGRLEIVPGATHLFEEPGALERAAELTRDWSLRFLSRLNRDRLR